MHRDYPFFIGREMPPNEYTSLFLAKMTAIMKRCFGEILFRLHSCTRPEGRAFLPDRYLPAIASLLTQARRAGLPIGQKNDPNSVISVSGGEEYIFI